MSMLVASLFSLFIYADIGPSKLFNVFMMTVLGVTISGPYNLIVGTISVDLGTQPALAGNEKAMSTVTGLIDGTGSAGSAIGQFFVPVIQNAFGWTYVFYMFIIMVTISLIIIFPYRLTFQLFSKIFDLFHFAFSNISKFINPRISPQNIELQTK